MDLKIEEDDMLKHVQKDLGLLWSRREQLAHLPDEKTQEENEYLTTFDLDILFTTEFDDEYVQCINVTEQNFLIAKFGGMNITKPLVVMKNRWEDDDLPPDVIMYLDLVCSKLDAECVPNLFRNEKLSPMSNWITHLLINHKLRSTYDFEKALARELFDGSTHWWSILSIDKIGGKFTALDSIFELKQVGNFSGAKRGHVSGSRCEGRKNKLPKLDELIDGTCKLSLNMQASDSSPELRVAQNREVVDMIRVKSKPTKLGKKSPNKKWILNNPAMIGGNYTRVDDGGDFKQVQCGGGELMPKFPKKKKVWISSPGRGAGSILGYITRTPRVVRVSNRLVTRDGAVNNKQDGSLSVRKQVGSVVLDNQLMDLEQQQKHSQALDTMHKKSQD